MSFFGNYSYRYPNCSDYKKHQEEAREDARYGSYSHRPSPFDERDCKFAYDDERRTEQFRIEEKELEEREALEYEQRCERQRREAENAAEERQRLEQEEYERSLNQQSEQF